MAYINTTTMQYPLYEGDIRAAFPNVSFPAMFVPPAGYADVVAMAQPSFNPITQRVTEGTPQHVGGSWVQTWQVLTLSAAEAAANQAAKDALDKEVADLTAAKGYAKLTALAALSPAEVSAWVDANVTGLPSVKDIIKTLAIAVSILARRL